MFNYSLLNDISFNFTQIKDQGMIEVGRAIKLIHTIILQIN